MTELCPIDRTDGRACNYRTMQKFHLLALAILSIRTIPNMAIDLLLTRKKSSPKSAAFALFTRLGSNPLRCQTASRKDPIIPNFNGDLSQLLARIPQHHNEGDGYVQENSTRSSSTKSTSNPTSSVRSKIPIREEIRYIAGRRALLVHPPHKPTINTMPKYPPLVLLGGMAQSISSWEFHLSSLSQHRSVLVYEALGQGPPPPSEVCSIDVEDGGKREVTLDQYYKDVSLERQGVDFWEVVDEAFFSTDSYYHKHFASEDMDNICNKKVDVAGFSFGGRVAMAAASLEPNRIRRLHLTGVSAERDPLANVILASWKEILGVNVGRSAAGYNEEKEGYDDEECDPENHASRCTSRLRSFAWSIILSTYSEQFLANSGPNRVQAWVDGICRYNTEEGLKALLMQTHGHFLDESKNEDNYNSWTPARLAMRIQTSVSIEHCRVVVGSEDKMASPMQALRLAKLLGLPGKNKISENGISCSYKVIDGCGHAAPMEAMRPWREDVLSFLNQ